MNNKAKNHKSKLTLMNIQDSIGETKLHQVKAANLNVNMVSLKKFIAECVLTKALQ
jgi:hypothetical protein